MKTKEHSSSLTSTILELVLYRGFSLFKVHVVYKVVYSYFYFFSFLIYIFLNLLSILWRTIWSKTVKPTQWILTVVNNPFSRQSRCNSLIWEGHHNSLLDRNKFPVKLLLKRQLCIEQNCHLKYQWVYTNCQCHNKYF